MSDQSPQEQPRSPWWAREWDQPGTPGAEGAPAGAPAGSAEDSAPAGYADPYSPYGAPGGGGGSYGPGRPPAGAGGGSRRPAGRKVLATAAGALAIALVAGGAGAEIGIHATGTPATSTSAAGNLTTAPVIARGGTSQSVTEAVAAAVAPSVVSIDETGPQISGTGSGVIIRSDGYILTNNHVVSGAANGGSLTVTFNNGKTAPAQIVGRDPSSDLAVIKVTGMGTLPAARLGNSSAAKVGESVLAFGSPLGLQGTVTEGIVSALHRPVHTGDPSVSDTNAVIDAVQTDAAINPGNSGGPLVDMQGNVIGIDSAIATVGSGSSSPFGGGGQSGSIGVGFAIPINSAQQVANQIIATGYATHAELGVTASDTQNNAGALIHSVVAGSAAAHAGLQQGDVITAVNGKPVIDSDTLVVAIRNQQPGARASITYTRNGTSHSVTVTLGSVKD